MWFELLRINAGNLTWGFCDIGQNDMTALGQRYNIEELLNWQEPYVKSLEKMKVFLKCVVSYLSRGNFEGELYGNLEAIWELRGRHWLIRPRNPKEAVYKQ